MPIRNNPIHAIQSNLILNIEFVFKIQNVSIWIRLQNSKCLNKFKIKTSKLTYKYYQNVRNPLINRFGFMRVNIILIHNIVYVIVIE